MGIIDEYAGMKMRAEDREMWRNWMPKTCLQAENWKREQKKINMSNYNNFFKMAKLPYKTVILVHKVKITVQNAITVHPLPYVENLPPCVKITVQNGNYRTFGNPAMG